MPHPGGDGDEHIKMEIPLSITIKMDMEYLNWYYRVSMKFEIPDPMTPGNPLQKMDIDYKVMLDTKSKTGAFALAGVMPGMPEALNNCSWVKIPWLPEPTVLAACVKEGFSKDGLAPPDVPGMDIQGPACSPVGDLDLWTIKIENKTSGLKVTEGITMDKDMMLRGIDVTSKTGTKDGTFVPTVWGALTSKDAPRPIGPAVEDLDFTKWGFDKCTEIPIPSGASFIPQMAQTDIMRQVLKLAQSKPGAGMVVPLMMEQAGSGRRLQGGMPPIPGGMPEWAKCFLPPAGWESKSSLTGIVNV